MSKSNEAAAWTEAIAWDDSHGYDQGSRWGPNYDCSSLPIKAYELAGVPVMSRGATYTGNMLPVFLSCGFRDVVGQVNLATGAGLQRGDVLLNEAKHAAMYIGNGKLVNAGGNELGGVTGGQSGDQTGKEIRVMGYYNFPWEHVLRYEESGDTSGPTAGSDTYGQSGSGPAVAGDSYTVKSGDNLTAIAAAMGVELHELAAANGISNINLIFPGQVIHRPGGATSPTAQTEPAADDKETEQPTGADGDTERERITALARAVIAGEYGNGMTRVLKLGKDYKAVQAEVNRILLG